ncbi:MAG: hypothetical protein ACE5D6_01505 [Candidatus Zixiibacteriota bacterium]
MLTEGGTKNQRKILEERLTAIVNVMSKNNWETITDYCTTEGLAGLKELVERTECKNVNPLYETKLISLPEGGFEVRDIKVKVNMAKMKGNPYQYMVFSIDKEGLMNYVRFALEKYNYKEIIGEGEKLDDFANRQYILQTLEIFRTAYNRKDLEYLRGIYSDDALIIVGKVLKREPREQDFLEQSQLSTQKIKFIKQSKKEYIERLDRIFKNVAFLKVNFEEVTITRHPKYKDIYGITLKQYWKTPNYYDEGYLFLMFDFKDMNRPLIHVRSWQPQRFEDGSIMNLGMFEIIE